MPSSLHPPMGHTPDLYEAYDESFDRQENAQQHLIPIKNIQQPDDFSCGGVACLMVLRFYGVGEQKLDNLDKILGTNRKTSTHPHAIRDYLISLGLQVEAHDHMTLEDLNEYWSRGWPIICPLQEYNEEPAGVDEDLMYYAEKFLGQLSSEA